MSTVSTHAQDTHPNGNDRPRSRARSGRVHAALTPATIASALVLLIAIAWALFPGLFTHFDPNDGGDTPEIGRASCRERV